MFKDLIYRGRNSNNELLYQIIDSHFTTDEIVLRLLYDYNEPLPAEHLAAIALLYGKRKLNLSRNMAVYIINAIKRNNFIIIRKAHIAHRLHIIGHNDLYECVIRHVEYFSNIKLR